jgi:hypothetical protein
VISDEPKTVAVFGGRFLVGIVGVQAAILGVGYYLRLQSWDNVSWLQFPATILKRTEQGLYIWISSYVCRVDSLVVVYIVYIGS